MNHESAGDSWSLTSAVQAVQSIAHRLGVDCADATILHKSKHISIYVHPANIVARVLRITGVEAKANLRRELAIASYLVKTGAPVAAPTAELPAGPHVCDGFALTFWPYIDHVAMDPENDDHMASATDAMRRLHNALAGYPGDLPFWKDKMAACRTLLTDGASLSALGDEKRTFLLMVFDRIMRQLDALPVGSVPIHGDAGAHNIFITPAGALYHDLEDVCLGPREWDIASLLGTDLGTNLSAFEPINHAVLKAVSELRSCCVAVWCGAHYDIPEKRDAADYHLAYLQERNS